MKIKFKEISQPLMGLERKSRRLEGLIKVQTVALTLTLLMQVLRRCRPRCNPSWPLRSRRVALYQWNMLVLKYVSVYCTCMITCLCACKCLWYPVSKSNMSECDQWHCKHWARPKQPPEDWHCFCEISRKSPYRAFTGFPSALGWYVLCIVMS